MDKIKEEFDVRKPKRKKVCKRDDKSMQTNLIERLEELSRTPPSEIGIERLSELEQLFDECSRCGISVPPTLIDLYRTLKRTQQVKMKKSKSTNSSGQQFGFPEHMPPFAQNAPSFAQNAALLAQNASPFAQNKFGPGPVHSVDTSKFIVACIVCDLVDLGYSRADAIGWIDLMCGDVNQLTRQSQFEIMTVAHKAKSSCLDLEDVERVIGKLFAKNKE